MTDSGAKVRRAFVALGSNLGDRWAYLRGAVDGFDDIDAVSDVYETKPVGGPEQGPYLNMVVRLRTAASARDLLAQCRASGNWRQAGYGWCAGGPAPSTQTCCGSMASGWMLPTL